MTTLKENLINSINQLSKNPIQPETTRFRLFQLTKQLENNRIFIPENHYAQVINFVMLMMQEAPEAFIAPHDSQLKDLCCRCITQLNNTYDSPKRP